MISVILPTYNRAGYLPKAIKSFTDQNAEAELIVVSDGSTDNTAEVMAGIKDERVKFIKNDKNIGIAATMNRGVDLARFDIIGHIHSDDELMPGVLAKRPEWHKYAEVVYTDWEQMYCDGQPAGVYTCKPASVLEIVKKEYVNWVTLSWRKETYKRVGGCDPSFISWFDWDFKIRCFMEAQCVYVPEVSIRYRVWGGQMSVVARTDGTNDRESAMMREKHRRLYGGVFA